MPRPSWPKAVVEQVVAAGAGKCHHCGVALDTSVRRNFHIDHYPVVYADIEDQVCCGVRDPLDPRNLVLSCPQCNLSHKYERSDRCGHSQYRCRRQWVRDGAGAAAASALGLVAGYALCATQAL
jgi:hypothetical protein